MSPQLPGWTLLDFVFVAIILTSTGFALTKGLARELISIVALLGGFIMAAYFYPVTGAWFVDLSRTESIAHLLGFLVIFLGTLLAGALVAYLVNRFIKMASLEWFDRVLGGIFGFLRGWAVASVLMLALIAFPARPDTIAKSYLAPYLLAGARAAVTVVPKEMRDQFHEQYRKVLQALNPNRTVA